MLKIDYTASIILDGYDFAIIANMINYYKANWPSQTDEDCLQTAICDMLEKNDIPESAINDILLYKYDDIKKWFLEEKEKYEKIHGV